MFAQSFTTNERPQLDLNPRWTRLLPHKFGINCPGSSIVFSCAQSQLHRLDFAHVCMKPSTHTQDMSSLLSRRALGTGTIYCNRQGVMGKAIISVTWTGTPKSCLGQSWTGRRSSSWVGIFGENRSKNYSSGAARRDSAAGPLRGSPEAVKETSQRWVGLAPTLGLPPQFVQRGFLEAYREKLPE